MISVRMAGAAVRCGTVQVDALAAAGRFEEAIGLCALCSSSSSSSDYTRGVDVEHLHDMCARQVTLSLSTISLACVRVGSSDNFHGWILHVVIANLTRHFAFVALLDLTCGWSTAGRMD